MHSRETGWELEQQSERNANDGDSYEPTPLAPTMAAQGTCTNSTESGPQRERHRNRPRLLPFRIGGADIFVEHGTQIFLKKHHLQAI